MLVYAKEVKDIKLPNKQKRRKEIVPSYQADTYKKSKEGQQYNRKIVMSRKKQ